MPPVTPSACARRRPASSRSSPTAARASDSSSPSCLQALGALGLAEADPPALRREPVRPSRGGGRESRSYSEKDSPPRTPRRVTKRVTAAGRDAAHIDASTIAAPAGWFHVTDSDRI